MTTLEAGDQRVLEALAVLCNQQAEGHHSINGESVDWIAEMSLLNALNKGESSMTIAVLREILNRLNGRGYLDTSQRNQVRIQQNGKIAVGAFLHNR